MAVADFRALVDAIRNLAQQGREARESARETEEPGQDKIDGSEGTEETPAHGAEAEMTSQQAAITSQIRKVLKSAQNGYKGSTEIGHALSKHAGRHPEIWGQLSGSMKTWNDKAMKHIWDIVRGSGEFKKVTVAKGVEFHEKRLSDGRGIRLNMDGTFKGFID